MNGISLRARLFAGAMAAIFVALAIAWAGLSTLFDRHIERRLLDDLTRQGLQLAGVAALDARGTLSVSDLPTDPRFDTPASGLYWQVSSGTRRLRSRSLWDQTLQGTTALQSGWQTREAAGPFGQNVIIVGRMVHFGRDPRRALIQVAADRDSLRGARDAFARELALSLGLLWVVLSLAAWVQVSLGLRPLADVGERLDLLRRDASARLTGAFPSEVRPLTAAIDALAQARESDVVRARGRAADLAHGLKTPLAALSALARRAEDRDPTVAAGLAQAIAAMSAAVAAELGRARAGVAASGAGRQSDPQQVAERVVNVLEHVEAAAQLSFEIDIPPGLTLPLAEEDLTELLGALAENAARHARRRVCIAARKTDGHLELSIGDDGPTEAASRQAEQLNAGRRLDESGGGHGLGLAIAQGIAEATGATMTFGNAALGGFQATIRWLATQ